MEQLEFNFEQPVFAKYKSIYEEKSEFFSKLISLVKSIQLLEESGSLSFEKTVLKYNLYQLLNENLKDVLFSLEHHSDFYGHSFSRKDYVFVGDLGFRKEILNCLYNFISLNVPFKYKDCSFLNLKKGYVTDSGNHIYNIKQEMFEGVSFGLDENFEAICDSLIDLDFDSFESTIRAVIGQELFDKLYSDNIDLKVLVALTGTNKKHEDVESCEQVEKVREFSESIGTAVVELQIIESQEKARQAITDKTKKHLFKKANCVDVDFVDNQNVTYEEEFDQFLNKLNEDVNKIGDELKHKMDSEREYLSQKISEGSPDAKFKRAKKTYVSGLDLEDIQDREIFASQKSREGLIKHLWNNMIRFNLSSGNFKELKEKINSLKTQKDLDEVVNIIKELEQVAKVNEDLRKEYSSHLMDGKVSVDQMAERFESLKSLTNLNIPQYIEGLEKTESGLGVIVPTDSRIDALEKSIEDIKRMISDIANK